MEITTLTKNTIKIKGKKSSFVIDPDKTLRVKTPADAVLLLHNLKDFDISKIDEQRLVIQGPGEYEVGGIKISGLRTTHELVYQIHIDGLDIAVANTSAVESMKDKLSARNILILHVNAKVEQSTIATLEPGIVIFYGDTSEVNAQGDEVITANKFSITLEKLPEKMQTILLTQ